MFLTYIKEKKVCIQLIKMCYTYIYIYILVLVLYSLKQRLNVLGQLLHGTHLNENVLEHIQLLHLRLHNAAQSLILRLELVHASLSLLLLLSRLFATLFHRYIIVLSPLHILVGVLDNNLVAKVHGRLVHLSELFLN